MSDTHGFTSVALDRCPNPDFVDCQAIQLPPGSPTDPRWWGQRAFSADGMPSWVIALMAVRQVAVRLLGLPPSPKDTLAVKEVVGDEALIMASERHLDFWCAVGVDVNQRLLRATTVVKLHGWRGRFYWGVVQFFHPIVTAAMLRRATRGVGLTS